jgi:hypothetical protein
MNRFLAIADRCAAFSNIALLLFMAGLFAWTGRELLRNFARE